MNPLSTLSPQMKKYITIAIVVIILIVTIYLWGKHSGTATSKTLPSDLPNMQTLTEDENKTVQTITNKLHEEIDGWFSVITYGDKNLTDLLTVSDRIFVAIYNYYNAVYGNGSTLLARFHRLWSWGNQDVETSLDARFNRLGLI